MRATRAAAQTPPRQLHCGMKDFVEAQLREGRFSPPSKYIRSLIRLDQEHTSRRALEAFVLQRTTAKRTKGRSNRVNDRSR
jgi:Arc/MetJ-type ribon-helix-helix transcriptional regulator